MLDHGVICVQTTITEILINQVVFAKNVNVIKTLICPVAVIVI